MKKIRAVSLFCGAGGMDLGFAKAGFDIVWANDFNRVACATHARNFGQVEIRCGSIMDFDYRRDIPDCELVFGGPPCQGFSVAGKMDPNDPRSKLVFEFQKVVAAKRPRYFVMENVAALGRLGKFAAVRNALLSEYVRLGYRVGFRILDCQEYGTPQRRERMIMIGTLEPVRGLPFPQPSPERISSRTVLARLDPPGCGDNQGVCPARITMAAHPVLRASPYAGMIFNGMGRPIDLDRPCQTLPASMGGNKTPFLDTHLLADAAAPDWLTATHAALLAGADPKTFAVPAHFRRITVSEAAALQGFPPDFTFCGSRCDQYRQIGNSVPPPFAERIARAVRAQMLAVAAGKMV